MRFIKCAKAFCRVVCIGLIAVIIAALCGCVADIDTYEELETALADSGSITVYSFDGGTVGTAPLDGERYKSFLSYYDSVYGGTVMTVSVEWNNWEKRFISDFASGTAPDLIYLYERNFLHLAKQSAIMSISELEDRGVVGLDHPQLFKNSDVSSRIFSIGEECYAFACAMAEADMVFVNEDLFKLYGVKSPSEYYNQGLWTQSVFEQCALSLTKDLNSDGKSDIFGYYGWEPSCFVAATGGELVGVQSDGTLELTLDNEKTLKGLSNFHRIYAEQKSGSFTSTWSNGNTAMISWLPSNEYTRLISGQLGFKWSVVPFPLDGGNTVGTRPGKCYGWAVTASSLNPQGCINYVIAYNTYSTTRPDPSARNYVSLFGQSKWQMFVDCATNISAPVYQSIGNLNDAQWDMWYALANGNRNFDEVINTYRPVFEQQVKLENDEAKQRS